MGFDGQLSVPRISSSDLGAFHERFLTRSKPVVVQGLEAGAVPALGWSAATLCQRLGERRLPILAAPDGFLSYERQTRPMSYAEFHSRTFGAERDASAERLYLKASLTELGLDEDARSLPPFEHYTRRAVLRNLWVSGRGITVGMHFDAAENLNLQLRGRKLFLLHPPALRGYYPQPMWSQTAHISGVFRDGSEHDQARFPEYDPGRGVRVELQAGELLYLPPYWWHQVTSLDDENVNLNYWWFPSLRKQLRHPNQALRGYCQLAIRRLRHGHIQAAPARRER